MPLLIDSDAVDINRSIHIFNSKDHYKQLNDYFIPDLTSIILGYLNSEICLWRFGFIVRKFKTFDDIIIHKGQVLSCPFPTIIYGKYIKTPILTKEIDLDWIDNFKRIIHQERKEVTHEIINKINTGEILYKEIKNVYFPLIDGIYKIIPISNTIMTTFLNYEDKDIHIEKPAYMNVTIETSGFNIVNIEGTYILEKYFLERNILNLIETLEIVIKNPFD